jgi:hypothetical protein
MPPWRLASRGVAPLCLVLAACGARSSLLPGEEAASGGGGSGGTASGGGGAGPGTTSSTSVTTSSSGGGGAGGAVSGVCDGLVVDGPPLSPTPLVGNKQAAPWLARTAKDGGAAALVYLETENQLGGFWQSSSAALPDAWGAWPAALGPSAIHGLTNGFAIGPGEDGRFSMLTSDEPNDAGGPTGMVMWAPKAGVSGAEGQFFDDVLPGFPVLASSNGDGHLAGFQRVVGGDLHHLELGWVTLGGPQLSFYDPAACSIFAPLSGEAIPVGEGFLAAFSSGRPFGSCLTDQFPDGPPTRVQIVTIPGHPVNPTLMSEYDQPDQYVFQTHLAPTAGGAWAAWERIPFEPPFQRRIQLVRLDATGVPGGGAILEVGYGTVAAPFAIAGLGKRVAFATMVEASEAGPHVSVWLLDEDGSPLGQAAFQAEPGFFLDYSVTLLASPAGDHLLVAWSESSAINNDDRRVVVARLACTGGE